MQRPFSRGSYTVDGIKNFFAELGGFLFAPKKTAAAAFDSDGVAPSGLARWYPLYVSLLVGVSMWFFLFYPEPLYYGTSGVALQAEVPSIIFPNPLTSLLIVIVSCVALFFAYTYLLIGNLSCSIMKKLAGKTDVSRSRYLSAFAFTMTPMLLWVPTMALRQFFFERWINLRPFYPFFDWNLASASHLALIGALILYKLYVETRINQAAFKTSLAKAAIPPLVQAALLAGLLVLPVLLNDLIFNALKDGLT